MTKKKKLLKSVNTSLCLGLLTLFLATTAIPVLANNNFGLNHNQAPINQQDSYISAATSVNSSENLSDNLKETANSTITNPQALLERGRILFDKERFAEAAQIWEQAEKSFSVQKDITKQALSLNYLSLAYQNLGQLQKAETSIGKSLNLLQQKKDNTAIIAVVLNTKGSIQLAKGETEAALETWQQAERAYVNAGDKSGEIGSKINQAQALQALGLHRRAQKQLAGVNEKLQTQPDSELKVKALHSLGVALQVVGDLQKSQEILEQSLAISQRLKLEVERSDILLSLGNTKRNLEKIDAALDDYEQAAQTTNPLVQVEAQLNQLSLYIETNQLKVVDTLLPRIASGLENLPPSRMSVYSAVNFARSLQKLSQQTPPSPTPHSPLPTPLLNTAAQVLARGVKQAESLNDTRAKAYALNELGKLYEQTQQLPEALKLSQQALQLAQNINASDISYQASWQIGRILKIQGDNKNAIASYDNSVKTLKSLRSDLVAINRDVQFTFQETVEPVYREFVSLLLDSNPGEKDLKQAREVIEDLQLAELDNFFREACLDSKVEEIDQIDKEAAVIYPIILNDRLEVIVSIPGQPLSHHQTKIAKTEIEDIVRKTRKSINPAFSNQERLQQAQQVYDWLIRPVEPQLAKSKIKTLAFVLDGSLRNLPMAALYDGKQYLIEKYSVALSPGLQLMQSRKLKGGNFQVITAGLSESRQGFKALPAVKSEVKDIASKVSSKTLLNETFTSNNLKNLIKSTPFSVLHLATHGQFSSNSNDTFILTWDGRINVKELDEVLKKRAESESTPVELMVLSACQTAKGDNRAILGLAGVAVRSGARSTLATLWAVKDESTAQFMGEFYKQLRQPNITKAEALRQAQLQFIKNGDLNHPFYWASFVLIGNWL
ncbi:MAG: CHAT domain-containing protein [Scytonematopsis contorta HA4267-MV1]|jgi:CHAT domain-containing protein|nr:CHAT domain-containing protein [Scytonematopsis contorta HA4267-MV1]